MGWPEYFKNRCSCGSVHLFAFMHLADAFIQSNLQYIQVIYFLVSTCVPWESNPQPLRYQRNALTTEPQEHSGRALH